MKLLQINISANTGSTGRITENIGKKVMDSGNKSYIASSKVGPAGSASNHIRIGNKLDRYLHAIKTRVVDKHGFGSKRATRELVDKIDSIDPDIIGLHNLHGYYLNIEILFNYLKKVQKPVVWTFHDCWPFTGHCVYFDSVNCERWKTGCYSCPLKTKYPASYGQDNSKWNYEKKKELFNGLDNLTIVTPSHWLKELVGQSFLKSYPVQVIHNGIDTEVFSPGASDLPSALRNIDNKIVLGVASVWDRRKGLKEFVKLNEILDDEYRIVLVGLDDEQIRKLPDGITGIARTENVQQLAAIYGAAEVFVNPTWSDNFPTTNIEALACGTPVITYRTGGSPEAIDNQTGIVVEQGDINEIKHAIIKISEKTSHVFKGKCRNRAINDFNKQIQYDKYLKLYDSIIGDNI